MATPQTPSEKEWMDQKVGIRPIKVTNAPSATDIADLAFLSSGLL
jgi:hypothetical protein